MQPQRSPNQEVLRHVPLNLIRGSVIGQLVLHYFMFVVLILTANWMGLSANIRNYSVFLYLNAAMYTMQVFRVLYFLNEKSIVPFYISLVPFAIMCVISREAHMLATALWYVSFFIIYLQTGRPNMQKHLVGYSVGFITVYVACVAFMAWFYRSDCTDLVCGTALSEPISWPHEIVWLIACVVVVFCFMTLERFIKRNALTLLERESYVTNLMQANVELKRELKRMKMDKGADLDAPLTRVIQIIREIRDSGETDHDTNASLDMVIKVLTSNDLFNVDVQKKAQDADVADFLNSLMQKGGGAIADAGQQQRGSVSARSNNVPGSVTAMNNAASLGNAAASKVRALSGAAGYQSTATTAAAGGVGTAGESGGTTAAGLGSGGAGSDAIRAQASTTAPFTFDDCAGKRDSIETLVPKEITHLSPDRIAGIESCLEFLETADFDVIQLNELTHGHPVYFTGMRIFERHKLGAAFDIDPRVMQNFLLAVESGYIGANPYHNAMHAADVTASMNYYLTRDRLYGRVPPDEMFAALVAALIHDLSHPGVNNPFLIKTGDRLAMQYNDQAVLEHYHCAMAFAIMRSSPSFNIMCTLTNEQSKAVRDIVVSLVLATDMAMHFEFITKFKNRIEAFLPTAAGGPVAAPNGATPPPPAAPAATGAAAGTNPHGSQATVPAAVAATTAAAAPSPVQGNVLFGFDMDKRADRKFVLQVAMKCADVNNPSKPLTLCTQWTAFIMEEFFRQGDEERRRGMEISMLMDRYNTDIPKCQVGFIDFVVGPLFDVWGKFMEDDIKPLTTNIASNKRTILTLHFACRNEDTHHKTYEPQNTGNKKCLKRSRHFHRRRQHPLLLRQQLHWTRPWTVS
ncbi:hypothetical protein BC828DRAFT_384275 [Blastocladiella britannica]|nr:hypothetical protein BC828DRAFT_384275 [Blastocladiella britannica]